MCPRAFGAPEGAWLPEFLEELACERAGRSGILTGVEIAVHEDVGLPQRSATELDTQFAHFVLRGPWRPRAQTHRILLVVGETGDAVADEGVGAIAAGGHHCDRCVTHDRQRLPR